MEIIGARLHEVDVHGDGLTVAQAADLCQALGHLVLRPVKVEPCDEGPSKDQKGHFDRDDDEDDDEEQEQHVKLRKYVVIASEEAFRSEFRHTHTHTHTHTHASEEARWRWFRSVLGRKPNGNRRGDTG